MEGFLQRHGDSVTGVLMGWDRLLFRGSLMSLSYPDGLGGFLGSRGILYKDYGMWAQQMSERLKDHAREMAGCCGREFRYLASSSLRKEQVAREIIERDGIKEGLVCVLSCVESCIAMSIRRNAASGHLSLAKQERKCLHLYFYYLDREFGLMHVRLQTWLPFGIAVCLNGREYLARRMEKAGIGFEQRDNCFSRIDDLPKAQKMLEDLDRRRWDRTLAAMAKRVNPLLKELDLWGYYWSVRESEYATDVMFKDQQSLKEIYPLLVDHAMKQMGSQEVMRFLGRRTNSRFNGEVTSDIQVRCEGMRIKHRVEENSIKMYDKQGSVLRIETTINNPKRLRVYRSVRHKGRRVKRWAPMRRGVCDMFRRAEVCRAANGRYLQALSAVSQTGVISRVLDPVSRRITKDQRPYRALRPISPEETRLFGIVMQGQFLVHGFTNQDLRLQLMNPAVTDPALKRRQSGQITRILRLYRAHGLIGKVSKTRLYRTTERGQRLMTAALRIRQTEFSRLAA
jgi:hypothetical protein